MVVEADLANRAHVGPGVEPARHDAGRLGWISGKEMRVMRMDAGGQVNGLPARGQRARPLPFGVVFRRHNHQQPLQPGVAGPADDGIEIGDELLAGEVAVAIDHGAVNARGCRARPDRG